MISFVLCICVVNMVDPYYNCSSNLLLRKNALFWYILPKKKVGYMKQPYYESTCPVEAALQLIGGKYKTIILWHLLNKTMRYSELHRLVPRATDKMLAQQLRELEKDGLVNRKVYPVIPPKTEYSLTEFGRTLEPVLNSLCSWGQYYISTQSDQNTETCEGRDKCAQ